MNMWIGVKLQEKYNYVNQKGKLLYFLSFIKKLCFHLILSLPCTRFLYLR
jgi:hypothetical protein